MAGSLGNKISKEQKELCRIITPEFRVSYPHLFKAQAVKATDKPKFSVTGLFDKKKDLMGQSPDGKPRSLKDVIKQAKINAFGPDKANWPADLISPVSDGDADDHHKKGEKEGYRGNWVIKFSTGEDQRPSVVDHDMTPITSESALYPGCYARAYVYAYVWEYMGRQGVGFILDHVQKLRDGKSFAGKKPVEQVFGAVAASQSEEPAGDDMDFR